MKSKKGISFELLVTILGFLGAFVVLAIIVISSVGEEKRTGEETACTMSAWANCLGHQATFGAQGFKLRCPENLITITMSDLKAQAGWAEKQMKDLAKMFPNLKNRYVDDSPNEDLKLEFAMNNIVAKEMKKCWDHFKGVPCLFTRWWEPFQCIPDQPNAEETRGCKGFIEKIQVWDWKPNVPTFCVICARISFDKSIQDKFTERIYIKDWLRVNEIPPATKVTYAEHLKDDLHVEGALSLYSYNTQSPHAIIFGKVNLNALVQFAKWTVGGVEWLHEQLGAAGAPGRYIISLIAGTKEERERLLKDQRSLLLIPLDDVKNQCVHIEG